MAEDAGEKTEAPTPRRRQEAREQGNIARSMDLSSAALLVGIMVLLKWFGGDIITALKSLMAESLSARSIADFNTQSPLQIWTNAAKVVGASMFPLFAGLGLVGIGANMAQTGFSFSTKRITPNFGALNPVRGLQRIFGQGQGAMKLVMSVAKMALVGLTAYSAVHGRLGDIVLSQQLSFLQAFGLSWQIVYSICMRIGILLLVLALLDYIWQRFRVERDLKMTKQEVKDEMRKMDGDPHIKNRRRQIAMQMARERLKKDVPTADVVVTNPTEFAIALKYDSSTMHAPRVLAKGQGYMAMRIREIAIQNGIPILERKPLARALFKLVNVGQEIPEQFYSAVAEILAYVYELTGKKRSREREMASV